MPSCPSCAKLGPTYGFALKLGPRYEPVSISPWRARPSRARSRSAAARSRSRIRARCCFPQAGHTKLDLVRYYLAVAEGALRGAGGRPNVLVRYPERDRRRVLLSEARAATRGPTGSRSWRCSFRPAARAEEVVPRDAAALAWMANLACLELHPHPVRADDLDHPDELRVDLDPVPGVSWAQLREVARVSCTRRSTTLASSAGRRPRARAASTSTCASSGAWTFDEVRRAALALAREVERRAPALATSKWWKEERHGVFLDYNQNAKDRTVAAAYSVRPTPDARVSAPLTWEEIDDVRARRLHAGDHAGAVRGDRRSARRHRRARRARSTRCSSCPRATSARASATRRGRRTTASRPGEPPRVQPSKPATCCRKHPLIEIGRAQKKEDALAGLERWKPRHPDAAAHSSRPTCWSTRCAAGSRRGRASA